MSKQSDLIPTIPAFDKLSLQDTNHHDPREANPAATWRHTQSRTRVCAFEQNPDHDLVLFGHDVLDTDLKVGLSKTLDTAGYQFLMKALQARKDWKGLETAAIEETKGKIAASDAWQYVAIARMRMGNAAGAKETIEKYKSSTSGSDGLELDVWNQVLQRKVSEATLETVKRQDGAQQIHDLYLVALVDLERKKTEDAQESLKQAIQNDDAEDMDPRGWVVYGRICDQYGFTDAAATAWKKARAAKIVTREQEWALATIEK